MGVRAVGAVAHGARPCASFSVWFATWLSGLRDQRDLMVEIPPPSVMEVALAVALSARAGGTKVSWGDPERSQHPREFHCGTGAQPRLVGGAGVRPPGAPR